MIGEKKLPKISTKKFYSSSESKGHRWKEIQSSYRENCDQIILCMEKLPLRGKVIRNILSTIRYASFQNINEVKNEDNVYSFLI